MTPDPFMLTAVQATVDMSAVRSVADQRRELRARRNLAVWQMFHESGLSAHQIVNQMRALLVERGIDPDRAASLVPSHDTVQRAVGTRANPRPRPTL